MLMLLDSAPSPLEGEGWGEGDGGINGHRGTPSHIPPLPNPIPPGEREPHIVGQALHGAIESDSLRAKADRAPGHHQGCAMSDHVCEPVERFDRRRLPP